VLSERDMTDVDRAVPVMTTERPPWCVGVGVRGIVYLPTDIAMSVVTLCRCHGAVCGWMDGCVYVCAAVRVAVLSCLSIAS